jgi:LysM repeat protein
LAYHRGVAVSRAPGDPPHPISWASRLLAPLALIVVLVAIGAIIVVNTGDSGNAEQDTKARIEAEGKGDGSGAENPKTYTVEEGDTLSGVAAKFDVSVKRLERLNPDIDPQTLSTGQELKIR